jgi:hypothetical protein
MAEMTLEYMKQSLIAYIASKGSTAVTFKTVSESSASLALPIAGIKTPERSYSLVLCGTYYDGDGRQLNPYMSLHIAEAPIFREYFPGGLNNDIIDWFFVAAYAKHGPPMTYLRMRDEVISYLNDNLIPFGEFSFYPRDTNTLRLALPLSGISTPVNARYVCLRGKYGSPRGYDGHKPLDTTPAIYLIDDSGTRYMETSIIGGVILQQALKRVLPVTKALEPHKLLARIDRALDNIYNTPTIHF